MNQSMYICMLYKMHKLILKMADLKKLDIKKKNEPTKVSSLCYYLWSNRVW